MSFFFGSVRLKISLLLSCLHSLSFRLLFPINFIIKLSQTELDGLYYSVYPFGGREFFESYPHLNGALKDCAF